jgi:hypothetical protein
MQPYTCFSPLSWYLLFFSFTSRLYKRIRDAEMCQLQIFSPPTEKSRSFRLRRFFHTGGLHPWILSNSPPVLWRWLSPTSPYRYFPSRRRCVCGVGFYIYKFLIQRNKEEMGNSRLFEMFPFTFSSHLALSPFTHISPPPPNYLMEKRQTK